MARCGTALQGDELVSDGAAELAYRFLGDVGFEEVRAFDHEGCFWHRDLHAELGFSSRRFRVRFGGARIRDRYRAAVWRGTVEVLGSPILRTTGRGFEHPEEGCWRSGPVTIGFASETYGDADAIELEVADLAACRVRVGGTIGGYVKIGDPRAGNPFVHAPTFELEVDGRELVERGRVRRELGGEGLFVAVERLTDRPLPVDVAGTVAIEPRPGPFGFRPVFLEARQLDDAKVWTSAIYVTFRAGRVPADGEGEE